MEENKKKTQKNKKPGISIENKVLSFAIIKPPNSKQPFRFSKTQV